MKVIRFDGLSSTGAHWSHVLPRRHARLSTASARCSEVLRTGPPIAQGGEINGFTHAVACVHRLHRGRYTKWTLPILTMCSGTSGPFSGKLADRPQAVPAKRRLAGLRGCSGRPLSRLSASRRRTARLCVTTTTVTPSAPTISPCVDSPVNAAPSDLRSSSSSTCWHDAGARRRNQLLRVRHDCFQVDFRIAAVAQPMLVTSPALGKAWMHNSVSRSD